MKFLQRNQVNTLGVYYTNLIGRAITTYNSRETSYLQESEEMFVFDKATDITLDKASSKTIVAILRSGGAMPFRVGEWVQKRVLVGSKYSVAVYESYI